MSFSFLDSTARTAWGNGTSQTGQLEAFAALWSGDVSVRYYTSGGTHLGTATHSGWDAIDTSTTPYSVTLAGRPAWSHLADGTAAYCIVAVPGGADIIRADVTLAKVVNASNGIVNLDDAAGAAGLRINAASALPFSDLPAWRASMAQWEWVQFPAASISHTQPTVAPPAPSNQKNRVEAYCGKVVWGTHYGSAGNGGHADWSGNEALDCDLGVETPGAPVMLRQPTANAYLLDNTDYYSEEPDGKSRPTSTHTYYCLHYDNLRSQIVRLGVMAGNGNGNWNSPTCDAFDLSTNDWLPPNTLSPCPEPLFLASAQCKDYNTGDIYASGESRLWRWNILTRSWSALAAFPQNGSAANARASCVDTLRNRVVIFGDAYRVANNGVLIYDIATDAWSTADMSGASAPLVAAESGNGGHYNAALDRYIIRPSWSSLTGPVFHSGGDMLLVHPTTWAVSSLTTTGGDSIPATNTGARGLFQPMPALGGYVFEPLGTGGVWFLASE